MKDFFSKINWWTISAIFFGLFLVMVIIFGEILPTHAAEVSIFGQDGFLLEEAGDPYSFIGPVFNNDSMYLGGNGNFGTLYQIDVNGSDTNVDGEMSLTYRLGEYGHTDWSGSMTSSGLDFRDYNVIKAVIVPKTYQDSSRRTIKFRVSTKNWVATSEIPHCWYVSNGENAIYFSDVNGQIYCLHGTPIAADDIAIESDGTFDVSRLYWGGSSNYTLNPAEEELESWVWRDDALDIEELDNIIISKILYVNKTFTIETKHNVSIECTKFGVSSSSATPTPTQGADEELMFSFIVKQHNDYLMYDVYGSSRESSIQPVNVNGNTNNALSYAISTYSLTTEFQYTVWYVSGGSFGNIGYLYFPCNSITKVLEYSLGTSLISSNFEYLRNNYNSINVSGTAGSVLWGFSTDLKIGYWRLRDSVGWSINLVTSENIHNLNLVNTSLNNSGFQWSTDSLNISGNSLNYPLVRAYRWGLGNAETITPTPDPNATPTPTPTATPTPPPHVIVVWPTSTPTPTPFIPIDIPGGNGENDLKPDTTEGILTDGLQWLRDNTSSGILAKAFSFVPNELQWLIWFFVFILILMAVIRLIIHFGG